MDSSASVQPRQCQRCGLGFSAPGLETTCPRCFGRSLLGSSSALGSSGAPAGRAQPWTLGAYELETEIGRGAMGVVYRARHRTLDRPAAVKVLLGARFQDDATRRRFIAEASLAARLDHPAIVPILEIGEADEVPYFAMKWIDGLSLDQWWKQSTRERHPQQAVAVVARIAAAVDHAHQRGVLHRDLKPANILMDAAGCPHVTDFGLARRLDAEAHHTVDGTVLGTPAYMAPEQAAGARDISVAADVWSLGAMLYELLAGRPPFLAASLPALLHAIAQEEPPPWPSSSSAPLARLRQRDLDTVLRHCLRKRPEERYRSAGELAADLERWLRDEPVRARPSHAGERLWRWARRHPSRAVAIVAAMVGFGAGLGGILWQAELARRSARLADIALHQAREALWQANFDRARAVRTSRQRGQRVEALRSIEAAARLRPDPRLREEYAAARELFDLEDAQASQPLPRNLTQLAYDGVANRFAYSLPDGRIRLHRCEDGAVLADWPGEAHVEHLDFLADGRVVALHTAREIVLREVSSGRVLQRGGRHSALTLSTQGQLAAYRTDDEAIHVVALGGAEPVARLKSPGITRLSFAPDGNHLALQADDRIELWRLKPLQRVAQLSMSATSLGVAWHPHRLALAIGCEDTRLLFWEPGAAPSAQLRQFAGHTREGVYPLFDPRGDWIVSYAWDGTLRVWDAATTQVVLETREARPLGFSRDGEWLAVQEAGNLVRWRLHRPNASRWLVPAGHSGNPPLGLSFTQGGQLLAAMRRGESVSVWDLATRRARLDVPVPEIADLGFTVTNSLWVLRGARMEDWGEPESWSGTELPSTRQSLSVPPSARQGWITPVGDVVLRFDHECWRRTPVGAIRTFPLTDQPFTSAANESSDGAWIATGAWNNQGNFGGELWIRSALDGRPARRLEMGNSAGLFSKDGRWFFAAGASAGQLFDCTGNPSAWREVRRFERKVAGFVRGPAAFSGDGLRLAWMVDDRRIRVLEPATGRELVCLTPSAESVSELALSPDGRQLAASTPLGIQLWDLNALRSELRELGLGW